VRNEQAHAPAYCCLGEGPLVLKPFSGMLLTFMRRLSPARTIAVAAWFAAAGAGAALAQPASSSLDKRWPGDPTPEETAPPPQQRQQPAQPQRPQQQVVPQPQVAPAPAQRPAQAPRQQTAAPPAAAEAPPAPPKPKPVQAATPPRAITCTGAFAKDSSHAKLATAFGNANVTWGEVDGPEATKLNATVLFPRDPKRRLEVLWTQEESRSDTQVIAVNGQSTWTAPKGVKLGLTVAALEKLNGKPFMMKGFKGDSGGLVTSWENGALDKLPGGCRMGVRFAPDAKAPAPAQGETDVLTSDKDYLSNAPALKAISPKISEILIGY